MSPDFSNIDIKLILTVFGIFVGVSLGLAILLLIWVIWRVKRIQLPPEADFMTALQATPLAVVVLLDLLIWFSLK